jgi:hypothetical protein
MSGSASLAAAKRRRATGMGGEISGPPGGVTCHRAPQRAPGQAGPGAGRRGGSAVPTVLAHMQQQDARIARLEQSSQEGGVGELSDEAVHARIQAVASAAFEEIAGRVTGVEKAVAQVAQPEATDLAYFRNKTEEIETAVADLKRLLLKVQSFAMETNCSMMKLNARVEKDADAEATRGRGREADEAARKKSQAAWEESIESRIQAAVEEKAKALASAMPAFCDAARDTDAGVGSDSGVEEGVEEVEDEVEVQDGEVEGEAH